MRLVVRGRNRLQELNFEWLDQGDAVRIERLPELRRDEVSAYLRHHGLMDSTAIEHIYRLLGGYPLLLVFARQLAQQAGGWEQIGGLEHGADRDFIATELLARILREERVAEMRTFLERGVIARWFNVEIVQVVLGMNVEEAQDLFRRLRHHSFIEYHPRGLRFHDKIRELLLASLRFTSPQEFTQSRDRLLAYYDQQRSLGQESLSSPIDDERA